MQNCYSLSRGAFSISGYKPLLSEALLKTLREMYKPLGYKPLLLEALLKFKTLRQMYKPLGYKSLLLEVLLNPLGRYISPLDITPSFRTPPKTL